MTLRARLAAQAIVLLSIVVLTSGCNVIGYGAHVLAGPPEVHAKYVLEKRPTVVYVKDMPSATAEKIEGDAVAAQVEQQIRDFELAPTIDSASVVDLQTSRPAQFHTMTPSQIAKAVGAEQVIYVQINESRVDMEAVNDMLRGKISATVSVYDSEENLLWPTQVDGSSVISYGTPTMRISDNVTRSSVERNLINELSVRVGSLFRTYKPE
jgi:hypothetical protein